MSVIVEVRNLRFSVGGVDILKDVSFDVEEGEFVGIIGPNGAGKSTLVKILVGEIKKYTGHVRVLGRVGYLPQVQTSRRDFPMKVREFAAMGAYAKERKISWSKVKETLEKVGLSNKSEHLIRELSPGEFQRLSLARAILSEPDVLILDEPEAGVDEMGRARFFELLDDLKKRIPHLTVLMVSHDIGMVFQSCTTVMCLNRTLHCHGPTSEIKIEDLKKIFVDFDLWIKGSRHYEIFHRK